MTGRWLFQQRPFLFRKLSRNKTSYVNIRADEKNNLFLRSQRVEKFDAKRLKGLLIVAAASIDACKGEVKTPDQINAHRLKCMITHWFETGNEILELLPTERQTNLFPTIDLQPSMNGEENAYE